MASMVQMFAPNHELRPDQYSNFEGYVSAAALFSSQFSCNDHKLNGSANTIWELASQNSPPLMEGPFTPAHQLASSACALQQPDQDDHSSYMHAIPRNINADLLSFHNHNPVSASFAVDFPLEDDCNVQQLNDLMALQRKISMYADLSQASMAAAADDQDDSLMQACSYGDEVKLCNLVRSFTFPPSAAAPRSSRDGGVARSPLILRSVDADINHGNLQSMQPANRRDQSSVATATTPCSHGDHQDDHRSMEVQLKTEGSEVSQCMLGGQDQQGSPQQKCVALSSRGFKQSKKRSASMSNSSSSLKAARLDTPPDVVHVRARRGQATDSHSLAERVRREKISQRMKVLQEIVPGCHKVLGKAMMLDEIINYVKSLQNQVEFLSLKLAAANQAGMASMIANEVKFLIPTGEYIGELNSSCQLIKSEPLMHSSIQ